MSKIEVDGFADRSGDLEYGFIEFKDGTRIGYAPGTRQADQDGLFEAQQPYLVAKEGREPKQAHYTAARKYVQEKIRPAKEKLDAARAGE